MISNEEYYPRDPFGSRNTAPEQQDTDPSNVAQVLDQMRRNMAGLAIIMRELSPKFDAPALKEQLDTQNSRRRYNDPPVDVDDRMAAAQAAAPRAEWGAADLTALRRAGAWIADADGYGYGIEADELKVLESPRQIEEIPAVARLLVRRLADLVPAPDVDAEIFDTSEVLNGIRIEKRS